MDKAVRLGQGGQGTVYLLPCGEGKSDKRTAIKVSNISDGDLIKQVG